MPSLPPPTVTAGRYGDEPLHGVGRGHAHDAASRPLSDKRDGATLPAALQEPSDSERQALPGDLSLFRSQHAAGRTGRAGGGLEVATGFSAGGKIWNRIRSFSHSGQFSGFPAGSSVAKSRFRIRSLMPFAAVLSEPRAG